ncbi:thioredoxin [Paraconexibacter sp.]|uniref:thioredoxin n=1 Tax=Paraconexibacter sp. TaxID=2949640 RepID=UPI003566BAE3
MATTTPSTAAPITSCPACGQRNRLNPTPTGAPACGRCHAKLPWLVDATTATFAAETTASVPVLVDFWAPWCGPCRIIAPALQQLAAQHAGRVKVVKVNIDEEPALASRFGVASIPTMVVIRGGAEVDRIVGALPAQALAGRLGL